jgi:antitoxin ParD1/3/4
MAMAERDPDIRPRIVIEGPLAERAQEMVDRREYETLEEVAEAAFEAFKREQVARHDRLRKLVQESLDDPRPGIPMEEAFARIEQQVRERRRA